MPTITISMRKPHSAVQHSLITYPGNVAAFCGRRFGKTDGCVQRLFYFAQQSPGLYWWVGLSWRSASMKRAWRLVHGIARQILQALDLKERDYINRSNYEVRIPGLGEIWFRTADNPTSLAGEGVHGVVLDEFSLMQEIVWTEYIQATLLDFGGWAAFIGVPKGNNWAANLWRAALERDEWQQLHATSYDNRHMDPASIDRIKTEVPERLFRQEYMAEIVDDAGAVFRNVVQQATATPQERLNGVHQYVMGVDWGKYEDFTVLSILDATTRELVYFDRFNQIDYEVQLPRLHGLYKRFRPYTIVAERNSMGDPLIEKLQRDGLPIHPFVTTAASKPQIIDALTLAFEQQSIRILNDEILINELQAYQMERLPSGMLRYGAPSGMHDDCVMSLALAWHGLALGSKRRASSREY